MANGKSSELDKQLFMIEYAAKENKLSEYIKDKIRVAIIDDDYADARRILSKYIDSSNEDVKSSIAWLLDDRSKTDEYKSMNHSLEIERVNNNDLREKLVVLQKELIEITKSKDKLEKEHNELLNKTQEDKIIDLVPGYVQDVTNNLQNDADEYFRRSLVWLVGGVMAILFAILFVIVSLKYRPDILSLNVVQILFIFTRGAVAIGILCWVAHYCFSMAKNFTGQMVRRKDTIHSIRFGEIFLKIFGSSVTKEETINVFKEWNNADNSPFNEPVKEPSISDLKDSITNASDLVKNIKEIATSVTLNKK